ncbi:hypothetical protein JNB_03720 [Janibacter sp. HTCC2649]|uniref:hypothetical protein n=1 Tax=Janibacter sp. HTCC2649 TaxID=313589 RepID=UPI000066EAA5|nr:hypothetical protein [Janibacter sp. HTCC2649]EAP99246.1 hypothetical protein JNB_03720 [Janibacter sp. HTCC2649]
MKSGTLHRWLPAAVAWVQAFVVLGPALGPGVVIAYDMPWSPDARWTPFVLGQDTPAPRVVPSDAVMVLLGKVLGAGLTQSLVLLAILVGLALGAVALLEEIAPDAGLAARCACAVAAVWNPFVSERLVIGQWVVVLGLAVLPWALRAALRTAQGTSGAYAVTLAVCVAGVGGVNSVLIVAAAVVPVLLTGLGRGTRSVLRSLAVVVATIVGVSAVWMVPSLVNSPPVSGASADAFGPGADTPFGVWGSLLSGGGFWNTASHPTARSVPLIALLAALLSLVAVASLVAEVRRSHRWPLAAPVLVGVAVVGLSAAPFARDAWSWLVTGLPGGGALRDSQKLLAIWVLALALGVGLVVERLLRVLPRAIIGSAAVGVTGLVVLLSPQMAWGMGGRLQAVDVPEGYRTAATRLSDLPPAEVGLLPWSQYRRYDWNDRRVSLTLGPRIIDQTVLFDDSLPLSSGRVDGESPRAARVSRAIAAGASPVQALRDAGVRYIAAELRTGLDVDVAAVRSSGVVVVDDPTLLVVDVGGGEHGASSSGPGRLGWLMSLLTAVVVITRGVVLQLRRRLPVGLLIFRP